MIRAGFFLYTKTGSVNLIKANFEDFILTSIVNAANADFIRLMEKVGWTKADAARHLELTPAVVTRYYGGQTRPSLTTLKLFKMIVEDGDPLPDTEGNIRGAKARYKPLLGWENRFLECFRPLSEAKRNMVIKRVQDVIAALPQRKNQKT
ncbi:MAG: hypothetical protein JWM99_401 [Verrucomicrobiales bacterium]|nr:hypothetical protein [Verrucomicrobiales bacterium]